MTLEEAILLIGTASTVIELPRRTAFSIAHYFSDGTLTHFKIDLELLERRIAEMHFKALPKDDQMILTVCAINTLVTHDSTYMLDFDVAAEVLGVKYESIPMFYEHLRLYVEANPN